MHRIIHIQPDAPPKPPAGAACNGCGVCCLSEPCPVGMLVSRSRSGACKALRWSDGARLYRCGMVSEPQAVLGLRSALLARMIARLARRWISAGTGCDADYIVG
ncbi:MAG: hypothetical protein JWQ11_4456 [Rhizobacter sp.]|nr:hypothetical protein [Rhizobacter sp.]